MSDMSMLSNPSLKQSFENIRQSNKSPLSSMKQRNNRSKSKSRNGISSGAMTERYMEDSAKKGSRASLNSSSINLQSTMTPKDSKQASYHQQTPVEPQIMHKTIETFDGGSPNNSKIEERLMSYKQIYDGRRTSRQQEKIRKEREPSKEKPDINHSSESIVEQKKLKIFEQVFVQLNPNNCMFIDPSTADYKTTQIQVIDILMDVFTQFEEESKPWDKQTFIKKCNDAYHKMPQGDKSDLIKLFNKDHRDNSASRKNLTFKPETNQKSSQMCMSNRQFGVTTFDQLYKQHTTINQRRERLKEDIISQQMKECTFRPHTNDQSRRKSGGGIHDRSIL